ncbi:MAG: hypothetical protein GWP08_04900 [Nitrospiraceae bacterium]|nr:hypothetical protein [Nitrospiraceae bacterium]
MKTIVLSDVHLQPTEEGQDRQAAFGTFLHKLADDGAERLIILGDLFDFWFEYKHVIFSEYFDVLRAFAELRDRGVEIHLVCGNHDFWAGRFLERQLGFHIYPDQAIMEFDGKRALLIHGDGLNPADRGYRIYKRLARARLVIWLFGLLHPDWAMGIAQRVSRTSRRMTRAADMSKGAEATALRAFAERTLAAGEADVIMCGHAHAATREEFPTPNGTGLYINTGEWMIRRSYVEWDGSEFTLHFIDNES